MKFKIQSQNSISCWLIIGIIFHLYPHIALAFKSCAHKPTCYQVNLGWMSISNTWKTISLISNWLFLLQRNSQWEKEGKAISFIFPVIKSFPIHYYYINIPIVSFYDNFLVKNLNHFPFDYGIKTFSTFMIRSFPPTLFLSIFLPRENPI